MNQLVASMKENQQANHLQFRDINCSYHKRLVSTIQNGELGTAKAFSQSFTHTKSQKTSTQKKNCLPPFKLAWLLIKFRRNGNKSGHNSGQSCTAIDATAIPMAVQIFL